MLLWAALGNHNGSCVGKVELQCSPEDCTAPPSTPPTAALRCSVAQQLKMAICPTTITTLAALWEPCYCDLCDGAAKLLGEPCAYCHESRWGCRSLSCPWCPVEILSSDRCLCGNQLIASYHETCSDCWLADYRARYHGAVALQSLWRGYKSRKQLKEQHAKEVRDVTPLWRTFDEQYELYVFCQNMLAELKKDDPTWDATKEPYYIWMMEYGPVIEEWETWMRRRGWVRPVRRNINVRLTLRFMDGVLQSCRMRNDDPRFLSAFVRTVERTQRH